MRTLLEGETMFVQGSGKKPYELKNSGGVISCSCPAWRNQSLAIDMRTCKHIKANVSNSSASVMPTANVVSSSVTASKAVKNVPPCLLAHTYNGEDVMGWWSSYKLDGVRAWWNGEDFISRLGNKYYAPSWFKALMPKGVVVDGELFAGNGRFQDTVSYVRKMNAVDSEWEQLKFRVFDMPNHGGVFEDRIEALSMLIKLKDPEAKHIEMLEFDEVRGVNGFKAAMEFHLVCAEKYGYEGIMLRKPGSLYEEGRSNTLLKVKSFIDCEATVIGYEKGKGRHKGRTGALIVKLDNGKEFSVGTGLSDKERDNPPAIGSTVSVKFQELSRDGIPRFPSYLGVRDYE